MIRISNFKIYEDISNEEIFNLILKKYAILKENVTENNMALPYTEQQN